MNNDPLWYKDAVIYEVHVRAFFDSDGDGIGDFQGLAQKLDYLQDLGVTAIWLLPFYPSPLKDDGYDIADYLKIHPSYGSLADFRFFLREAKKRGLHVITELVLNHTSDQHEWFKRARSGHARFRDYYVWSETPEKYKDARIIFKDFEVSNWTLDPIAKAYFWHRFYSHQPDLNYDHPEVQRAVMNVLDYWLEMGVDGLRLDAVPYLFEREGTHCENLPETHSFLKKLRHHVDERFKNKMLLAEANQWPEEAASYFGSGDECHMAFHFPIMPRLFMAIHMEDRFPVIDILQQTPSISDTNQWAIFLRNHDELTLEMVTDEERDYMYRVYAHDPQARINLGIRHRLAPLLRNHRRKIELMNGLLLSLPGTPVLYYGDEIGMGDNIYLGDRNGVRTPMQWSPDRNAGFSRANPQRLYLPVIIDPEYHYETINVEGQQNNPHSLLWWMKRLIALRKRFKAFSRGTIEFLHPENHKVLVFVRKYENEIILVIANLSRFVEYVELDLSVFKGMTPVELFSRSKFPRIGDLPYFVILGPHSFYWFSIEPQKAQISPEQKEEKIPEMVVRQTWEEIFEGKSTNPLEEILPAYLQARRWFGGKAKKISGVKILDIVPVPLELSKAYFVLTQVEYSEHQPETYFLALGFAQGEKGKQISAYSRHWIIAHVKNRSENAKTEPGVLYDILFDRDFCLQLFEMIYRKRQLKGRSGVMQAGRTKVLRQIQPELKTPPEPSVIKADQSNTSINYGDQWMLKIFRRPEQGINPDLEIGLFLTEKVSFPHIPPVAGFLKYQRQKKEEPMVLGILQGFIPNQGDAWRYTLDEIGRYFERMTATSSSLPHDFVGAGLKPAPTALFQLIKEEPPQGVREMISSYLELARLLGIRTAEMHMALASSPEDPMFAPDPFSVHYQRSLYQSMRNVTRQVFQQLSKQSKGFQEPLLQDAQKTLGLEGKILKFFRANLERRITGMRIRCHGDYHLGQVLYTGKDFIIIDFEGEPTRPLTERRLKRSALWDVAGMLRSFHYAAHSALFRHRARGEDAGRLEPWAFLWQNWVCSAFLKAYLKNASQMFFLPQTQEEQERLLNIYLLEKVIYELGYELNNRPDWLSIPLHGIQYFMEGAYPRAVQEREAA